MDEIFQESRGLKGALDVVKNSFNKPRRYGKNGELLIDYDETEYHRRHLGITESGLQHRSPASEEKGGSDGVDGTSEERREVV